MSDDNDSFISGENNNEFSISPKDLHNIVEVKVQEEVRKEISLDKANLFTVFGVFASIITFVSVEVQFLKTICSLGNIIGFSLIFIALMLLFILLLDHIGRGWRYSWRDQLKCFPWPLIVIIAVIFCIGGVSVYFASNELSCQKNAIYQRFETEFLDKQIELQNKYDHKLKELSMIIDDLKKKGLGKGDVSVHPSVNAKTNP